MYTIDVLENLEIQLGEIDYLMEEICNDSRIDLKRKEFLYIESAKDFISTTIDNIKLTLKKRYKKL